MPKLPHPSRRPLATAAVVSVAILSGCITGERPTLIPDTPIDDDSSAAVLERLDRADQLTFAATYDVIPSTTGAVTQATVVQSDGRRTITIGDVQFVTDGEFSETCRLSTDDCVDFLDDALVSDLNITHRFWGSAFASRLEIDASRRIGFTVGSATTIAGQPATCVDVVVVGGTVTYCALDAGVLARFFGADVSIELTSFTYDVPTDASGS